MLVYYVMYVKKRSDFSIGTQRCRSVAPVHSIGQCPMASQASVNSAYPAARKIAPQTPPPAANRSLAALTMQSASKSVMLIFLILISLISFAPRLIIHIVPIVLCIFKVVKIIVMIVVKILSVIVVPGSVLILVVIVMAAVRISASRRFSCGGRCRGGSGCLHISGLGRCGRSGCCGRPRRYRYNVSGSWLFALLGCGSPITSAKQSDEYRTYQHEESHLFVHFNSSL